MKIAMAECAGEVKSAQIQIESMNIISQFSFLNLDSSINNKFVMDFPRVSMKFEGMDVTKVENPRTLSTRDLMTFIVLKHHGFNQFLVVLSFLMTQ